MNRLIIICLILTGCTAVPVVRRFPAVPDVLLQPAPDLKPLADNQRQLSDILDNVNENYGTYYIEREKLILWQQWYTSQKQIFENIQE